MLWELIGVPGASPDSPASALLRSDHARAETPAQRASRRESMVPIRPDEAAEARLNVWSVLLGALAGVRDEDERLRLTLSGVPRLLPVDVVGGALRSPEGRWDRIQLQRNGRELEREAGSLLLPHLESLFQEASAEGWLEVRTEDAGGGWIGLSSALTDLGMQCFAALPIRTSVRSLGILMAGRRGFGFGADEQAALGIVAEQLGVGVEQIRLQDELERRSADLNRIVEERTRSLDRSRRRLQVLLKVTNLVVSKLEREPLFRAIAKAVRGAVELDRASLMLLEPDGRHLAVTTLMDGEVDGSSELEHREFFLPVDESVAGEVLELGRPVVCQDLQASTPEYEDRRLLRVGIRSYVSAPLMAGDRALGVLAVGSRAPRRYDDQDATFLLQVASQIALGIENMLAYERNEELRRQLELENRYLREEVHEARVFGEIVGQSQAVVRLVEEIVQVAPTDAAVLVQGESGVGKELVAREIHSRSERAGGPMIRVNCAAIPHELYESEFFGHVKGAFSGAVRDREGRFAAADGGTLFLDEVGEIPLELQGKLLRVLQDGSFQRVGEDRASVVDVRLIAASNRRLDLEVREGRFREDLYYRLNVFPIEVPPLRERKEDIPILAQYFLDELSGQGADAGEEIRLTEGNVVRLQAYDWPGNIRELRNAVHRAIITARGGRLHFNLPGIDAHGVSDANREVSAGGVEDTDAGPEVLTEIQMEALARRNLKRALERCDGKVYGPDGAAALLGVPPTTLASRIKRMGLD